MYLIFLGTFRGRCGATTSVPPVCHVDDDLSCSCAVIVHGRKFWLLKTTVDNVITFSRLASLFPLLRSRSGFKSSITVGTSILLRISTYAIGGAGSFFRKKDFLRRFWTTRILKLRLLFVHLSRNENRGSEKSLIALFPVSRFSFIQSYFYTSCWAIDILRCRYRAITYIKTNYVATEITEIGSNWRSQKIIEYVLVLYSIIHRNSK